MNRFLSILLPAALLCTTSAASANIDVVFTESAPKDRFAITNTSTCVYERLLIEVDLSKTAGNLIFDTTSAGAGVEVYQIFQIQQGDMALVSSPTVRDGDTTLTVRVNHLLPGETASFTIDVDDTLPDGELGMIRVSNSEISGGKVFMQLQDGQKFTASFEGGNSLSIKLPTCDNSN